LDLTAHPTHPRPPTQALFPDNTYAQDSGGDPAAIPDLTFAEFQAFYAAYYHPSNARFWFSGDDDPATRLEKLDAYLCEFERRDVDSAVRPQPLFDAPRRVVEHYAAGGEGEDGEEAAGGEPKNFVSLNWVLAEAPLDLETELALGFLNHLLLGTAAAPLRKALTDSGLGESLIGGGIEDELAQPTFSIGLKGVKAGADAAAVEELILSTLRELRAEGFAASAVEAAVNTIEFSLRENNTGRFPRGLSLMLRAMSAWIYDRDPFQPLKWRADLARFKERLASGEDVFGPLIDRFLLDNPHRVTVELRPDAALGAAQEAAERARLDAAAAAMAPAARAGVAADTAALRERQETPDAPEALACMPALRLADIPREAARVPTSASTSADGVTTLTHDLFTNGVLYLDVALDLTPVPAELLPLVPLFCASLTQMGTERESRVEFTERIGRKTGGVGAAPFASAARGRAEPVARVTLRGKAMADKAQVGGGGGGGGGLERAFQGALIRALSILRTATTLRSPIHHPPTNQDLVDIMRDVLLSSRLDDRERFRQMVLETKASLESGVVGAGHSFAGSRLDAQRSVAGWAGELMGGIAYLDYVRALVGRVENDWDAVEADLRRIRAALLQRAGALVSITGDERVAAAAAAALPSLLGALPATAGAAAGAPWAGALPARSEALVVPTQVSYVCQAFNLYEDAGYQLSGSSYVVSKLLGTTWIWDRVRVSGGAYGGFCDFDTHSGMFTYSSYRDPNLLKTVDVYDGAAEFLRTLELSKEEIDKAIIGTIGDIDAYQLPDAKGRTAMMRHLLGVSDAERQQRREEVLGTTAADFRAFGDALAAARPKGVVVAVTSADKVEAALAERPGFFQDVKRVL
jgi:Zn-dependent M16 (insulinase) family peptidase